MANQKQKSRTYGRFRMRTRDASMSRTGREKVFEPDSAYFLKLVVIVLLASFWIKFRAPGVGYYGIPAGMLVGLLLVSKFEPLQQNRKILYAVLIVVTVICYFVPAGIVV